MADDQTGHDHHHEDAAIIASDVATDPVCGMQVDAASSKHRLDHGGQTFHFCCARCREKFSADPFVYLTPTEEVAPAAPQGTIFTCPMHPEIRQDGPATCPTY